GRTHSTTRPSRQNAHPVTTTVRGPAVRAGLPTARDRWLSTACSPIGERPAYTRFWSRTDGRSVNHRSPTGGRQPFAFTRPRTKAGAYGIRTATKNTASDSANTLGPAPARCGNRVLGHCRRG